MDAGDLVRSLRMVGSVDGRAAVRSAWTRDRADTRDLPRRRAERARLPGTAVGAESLPGGGVVRFARAGLRIRVASGGAVFCGWDGAGPEPSYALAGPCPGVDPRVVLEPDKDGWRVVSERVTVVVSRSGQVEFRTPGGVLLRRDLPPRWWDPAGPDEGRAPGAGPRWVQRSETTADARVFGLGGRTCGVRLREGAYRLWNTAPGGSPRAGGDTSSITMPVQLVVADAGCHMVFHDNTWDGSVTLRDGAEGAGSGHDRPGGCEVRVDGGPLRYWVITGTPARILATWTGLTGRPALPARWALGHQHTWSGPRDAEEVRRTADGYRERGLPLAALHLDADRPDGRRVLSADRGRFPGPPPAGGESHGEEVRLVSVLGPAVRAEPGDAVYDSGTEAGAFVCDARGRTVCGVARPGRSVFPDFTDPGVRTWWGALYEERLARGFAGVWHDVNEPVSVTAFGENTLPLSSRHVLEGRGGDHREAHNVYGLSMARAGYESLLELRPASRPFLFSRSGWAGMQRYGGAGPGSTGAGWPALRESLSLVMGLGLCGVPFSGPDAGGSPVLSRVPSPSPELFLRSLQLAAFLPFLRTRGEPWAFGPEVSAHAGAALRERERLMPYLYTLAHLARRTGAPYVRPLWWSDPEDRRLRDCEDAFLLGDALLVAPVLESGAESRGVRLPRGRWCDMASGRVHEGSSLIRLETSIERIPVLVRAGAVLPVTASDGSVELEVWAPDPAGTGGGVLITDAGDGWGAPLVERFTTRSAGGEVLVEREGGVPAGYGVRVRGVS